MATASQLTTSFTLNNDKIASAVGLGTFQGDDDTLKAKEVVLNALLNGYVTSMERLPMATRKTRSYQRERNPRSEIFVTTKLAQSWHEPSDVEEALNQSLKALGLDYVDLYLMHSRNRHPSGNGKPVIDYERSRKYPETWQAMEKLVDSGKAKSIALSDQSRVIELQNSQTKRILEVARIRPAVNQVELHPYLPQHGLLKFYKEQNLHLMAHQPLGGKPVGVVAAHPEKPGPLFDSKIAEITNMTGMTPAQVILSWAVQRGTSVVPKTVHTHRLAENLCLSALSNEHFQIIDTLADPLESGPLRYLNPSKHLGSDIFSEADEPVANNAPWD